MTNETMTLGEALTVRADLQQRLGELRARLIAVAKVQEGEVPAEQPDVLLAEFEQTAERLRTLIARINRTNLTVATADGETLTDALARRDVLTFRYKVHRELAAAASEQAERYSLREIKMKATVDVAELRRTIDDLARNRRELDVALQAANWANTLAD
ncbi:MAG TPA: DIP1984 family protein [Gaiellaceae bacterium]